MSRGGEAFSPRAWLALLRELYCTFDRRTLGLTRILLGFLLTMDLLHRRGAWMDVYSSAGVLPTHVNLERQPVPGAFSIFNAFSSPGELRVLWALLLVNALCLMVGYRTKLAQILAVLLVTGMNGRTRLIESGGYIVENLLVMWTAFLPMGDRFSIDALVAAMKRRRESTAEELNDRSEPETPHVSLLGPVLCVQLAVIYYFNFVHKTGPAWHNGTAVHYVLYVDRLVTPIIALVRDHIPNALVLFMTKTTMTFEALLPFALLLPGLPVLAPFFEPPATRVAERTRIWLKRAAIFMMNTLHLAFGTAMALGPFAWSCCVFSTLLFSAEDWDLAARAMRRDHRARTVVFDPRSGGALFVCRIVARLDRFHLLGFEAREGVPLGIGIDAAPRAQAIIDIVAALPLGPIPAAFLGLPGIRRALDAILAAIESRDLSAFFGLAPRPSRTAPSPSPLHRNTAKAMTALRELFIVAMFAGAVNQGLVELDSIVARVQVGQPEPFWSLAQKMRLLQGWVMFSPNPPLEDGTLVVDAVTIDGRHLDPFTGKPPSWNLGAAKSLRLPQIWSDYFSHIIRPTNVAYRDALRDYLLRLPERTGRPNDAIVSGDVYWVKDDNPRWGETASWGYERSKLFSFERPAK